MTEKKKSRNFIATDEEWEMIQEAAGERHQSSSEFLISLALSEVSGEQEYINETTINMARHVYIIAASVVKEADKKWVEKTYKKAREVYPMDGGERVREYNDE